MGCSQSSENFTAGVTDATRLPPVWTIPARQGSVECTLGPKHDKVYVSRTLRTIAHGLPVRLDCSKAKGIVFLAPSDASEDPTIQAVARPVGWNTDKYRIFQTQPLFSGQAPFQKNFNYQEKKYFLYHYATVTGIGADTYDKLKWHVTLVHHLSTNKTDYILKCGPTNSEEKFLHSNIPSSTMISQWKYSRAQRLHDIRIPDPSDGSNIDVGLTLMLIVISDLASIQYYCG